MLEPDRVKEKIEEGKTWLTQQVDPAKLDQKPGCNR